MAVKIGKRQPVDLFAHLRTQPVADLVGNGRHDKALRVLHPGTESINSEQDRARFFDRIKINAPDPLHLVHEAVGNFSNDLSCDFRTDDRDRHRSDSTHDPDHKAPFIRSHIGQQLTHRFFHVFRFFMRSSFMRHIPIPPLKAGKEQFPGIRGRISSAVHGSLYPRPFLHQAR